MDRGVTFGRKLRWSLVCLTLIWWGIVIGFSSQPYQQQDIKPLLKQWVEPDTLVRILPPYRFHYGSSVIDPWKNPYSTAEFYLRKTAHMVEYGVLAVLIWLILPRRWNALGRVMLVLSLAGTTAGLDEWRQAAMPGRTGYFLDVLVDLTGSLLALGLVGTKRWGSGE